MTAPLDAVVIGAGPYGLAVAAELLRAGAGVHVFGDPMSFWIRHMPKGMCLRSTFEASHIGDQRGPFELHVFEREHARRLERPVPLADFIAYGRWFQARAVPDVDPSTVTRIDRHDGRFRVIADREAIDARRVIVAAGIAPFAVRPALFAGLDPDLASHSVEHSDLALFARRRVAVIGGGQSAIESAVLLKEYGGEVELIMRARSIHWVGRAPREGLLGPLLFDRTDVGPAVISHVVAHPMFVRRLPRAIQRDATRRALAPGASLWLRPRLNGLKISAGREVVTATRSGGQVDLRLDDGSRRGVDHVLMGTGYRVDVRRYPFLTTELIARMRHVDGQPVLDSAFQSSVPGLHFVGAPAAYSFGPLLRFVSGTAFTTRMVARHVTGARSDRATERAIEFQRVAS